MSKRETIERIMARNPTARAEFLAEFSLEDLTAYLRQLESASDESPPTAAAARPGAGTGPDWSSARTPPGLGG
jgi:hypothetical protein